MTTPTRLGGALASAATGPATSAFQQAIAGSRVCEPYKLVLPNGNVIDCAITLVGSDDLLDVEGFSRSAMEMRKLPVDVTTQHNTELERAKRTLAVAVRELDQKKGPDAPPLGSISDWGRLPPETIGHAYSRYIELRELHDPFSNGIRLEEYELAELREAISKKNAPYLRACGLMRLIAFLLTTADQQASSPTPKSMPGDSSPTT